MLIKIIRTSVTIPLLYSLVGHVGALDVVQTRENAELLNQRIKAFVVGKHRGELVRAIHWLFPITGMYLLKP